MTVKTLLQVSFEKKDEAKKLGAKWDTELKEWYYEGEELPDELKRFSKRVVVIEKEDKETLKHLFKSLKWNKNKFFWEVSQEDYEKLTK